MIDPRFAFLLHLDNVVGRMAQFTAGQVETRICKPVIPPHKGHHGGVLACFNGRGIVTGFQTLPEKPGVVDPF